MAYLYLALAILFEVAGTSLSKPSAGFTRLLPSLGIVVGYGASFYFLSLALRDIPTGVAYAIWAGVGIVLITGVAWLFQGQRLDGAAMTGITLIISGVVVMHLFSATAGH